MGVNYKIKKFGPVIERRDYSKTKTNLAVADLTDIPKKSFDWFLKLGLKEAFQNIYPIESSNGRIKLEFLPKSIRVEAPKDEFSAIKMAKVKGITHSASIYASLRVIDNDTAEVKTSEVLFGEMPYMTPGASFVVNGSEKVIVSQLIRAPGPYYGLNVRPGGKLAHGGDNLYTHLEIIPRLGVWMDVLHKTTVETMDFVKISINKRKLMSLSIFLRSLGLNRNDIINLFGDSLLVQETIRRDKHPTENDALEFVHGILRKGDRITNDSKRNLYANIFFNKRRYNLSRTGRYMLNKKLNLVERLTDTILAENLYTKGTKKILFKKGSLINFQMAQAIQESFQEGLLELTKIPSITQDVYGDQIEQFKNLKKRLNIYVVKVFPNEKWARDKREPVQVIGNDALANEEHLLVPDIIASISYYFNLHDGLGSADDKDSLENKRVVPIGELLQNQFQIALTKVERAAKERMSSKEPEKITAKNVTNNKSVYDQFKTFFNSSQLSQFMDQMNPLAEISNKRRLTSLGPGGLNRETAKFDVRDVHTTHYGRVCPIETPEGQNIGLILNFANYATINSLGFIETPYYKVNKGIVDFSKPVYLSVAEEVGHVFGQSSLLIDDLGKITNKIVIARQNGEYLEVSPNELEFIDVSSKQMTSVASTAIPFLENDDANRALMGANMQRQAVPLISSETPLVGTGIEAEIAKYSASNLKSKVSGEVTFVDSEVIEVKTKSRKKVLYKLRTFEKSNQNSVISQKPLVKIGDLVKENDLLTDGPAFDKGELALGKNVIVAFSTWGGYNYEDAIIISEKLVKDDVYTSIHIEEKKIEFRKQKLGDDELTTEIPNVSKFALRNLDSSGIIRVGSEVQAGDVLVGRISPKSEDNPTPEEKLIAAIFSQKSKNIKDTSLKVSHGHAGTVINVEVLSRDQGDKLQDDVSKIIKIYIAQKRKIKVGDKMAGRHGNKGVISIVLPVEDMPHLADGTPVDIMLNPQGVPSRMNIGQVLELHLGIAAKKLGIKFVTPVFDGLSYKHINETLKEANLPSDGKFELFDPISGRKFDQKVSVGVMYIMKLAHMVDDKMHARSVGPYSLITQQPLGGKSQNGGQRFGEMETWAVEAYGATNVLQELLTYKSDNISGRNKVYNALANGSPLPIPGTPESFNVLAYELRGLCMKLEVKLAEKDEE